MSDEEVAKVAAQEASEEVIPHLHLTGWVLSGVVCNVARTTREQFLLSAGNPLNSHPPSLEGMNENLYLLIDWSKAYLYIKKPAEATVNSIFSRSDKLVF